MTLTEFLLARIAEDEAAARDASPGGWQFGGVESVGGGSLYDISRLIASLVYEQPEDHDGTIVRHLLVSEANANGRHIVRWDPARVLAECEAKRRVIDLWRQAQREADMGAEWPVKQLFEGRLSIVEAALRALALPYADHPDYDEVLRP